MTEKTVGFIGFGNMAQAMLQGFLLKKELDPKQVFACAKDFEKLTGNAEKYGITPCRRPDETIKASDIVIVAVKPYMVEELLKPVEALLKGKIILSVAAGWNSEAYERILPGTHHLSTIPNTPVCTGEGIIICEEENTLTAEEARQVRELLSPLGLLEEVDGKHLSVAGTLAGCGPAFASMFLEALADGAVREGLPRATAYRLASQMVVGTGKMQLQTGMHPGAMKDGVCSPGGTTIVGVAALERGGFRSAVMDAIHAIETKE